MVVVDAERHDEQAAADDQVVVDLVGDVGDRQVEAGFGVALVVGADADVGPGLDQQSVHGAVEDQRRETGLERGVFVPHGAEVELGVAGQDELVEPGAVELELVDHRVHVVQLAAGVLVLGRGRRLGRGYRRDGGGGTGGGRARDGRGRRGAAPQRLDLLPHLLLLAEQLADPPLVLLAADVVAARGARSWAQPGPPPAAVARRRVRGLRQAGAGAQDREHQAPRGRAATEIGPHEFKHARLLPECRESPSRSVRRPHVVRPRTQRHSPDLQVVSPERRDTRLRPSSDGDRPSAGQ